jgi:polyisoprenoid-binding protein YceI
LPHETRHSPLPRCCCPAHRDIEPARRQAPTSVATLREFRIDAGHSEASFSIGFLGRPVKGRFDDIKGTLVYACRL